jgi:hypothetical protein
MLVGVNLCSTNGDQITGILWVILIFFKAVDRDLLTPLAAVTEDVVPVL